MTKKKLGILVFAIAAVALIALQACNLNVAYGIVSIDITGEARSSARSADPRTVLPEIQPVSYRISFTGDIQVESITTQATSRIRQILRPGEWVILVEGLNAEGEVIARGDSGAITVSSAAIVDVTVDLEAVSSGAGSVDITLTWPAPSATMPTITGAEVERDGAGVPPETLTADLAGDAPSIRYAETLASGSYRIVIRLLYGESSSTTYDEAIQVYANMPSSKAVALSEDRFTGRPTAPTGFAAVETVGGISLSWADVSEIESGYSVVRSDGQAQASLPANSTGWVDSGVTTGTTYTYSLSATNGTGKSSAVTVEGLKAAPVPGDAGAIAIGGITASSISLSWAAATDNHSQPAALLYQVFQDGAAIGEPAAGVLSRTVEGLSPATNYTFLVRASDEAGCSGDYQQAAATTAPESGVTITIVVIQPDELPMTLNVAEGQIVTGGTLDVSVEQTYSNYSWRLDGTVIGTGQGVSIDCSATTPGAHRLSLYVTYDSRLYSTSVDFRIQN